ncbi:P-loop containing nucleoside triphosphate hydrolase protein [Scenedesmus sp. NREL 46B-D3]|nr:P-loop containing nucleoside triphosphate hydrolase protein [Scenedesmus sp. NREL 46B-D3]
MLELALPHILSGKDVVLAAETGSGKTLAYIAPIASMLLERASRTAAAAAAAAAAEDSSSSARTSSRKQLALVLCPNAALCQQIIRLVSSLPGPEGRPLIKACQVSSSTPPPFDPPDVVVTTPGALVTLFNDRGSSYGPQWTAEGVSSRAAFVVADEADLLCQGGYVKDVTRLLDAFKAGERRQLEAQVLEELGIPDEEWDRVPRSIKQACWQGGAPAMLKAGFRRRPQQPQGELPDTDVPSSSSSGEADTPAERSAGDASPSSSSGSGSSDGSVTYGPYLKRQYLFVAATMPSLTKADVGVELQKRFRDAQWVSGDMLHQIKPHVEHAWRRLRGPEEGDAALVEAVQADPDYEAGQARVLVFARDTATADRLAAVLEEQGINNVLYHKNIPKDEREAALAAFADAAAGGAGGNVVMVSTDAAARGIDLPDVTHVVQADFATTAIEFLHRVGRTARAGKAGKVTSLYSKADAVLAEALKQYVQDGKPIEECFSRNRSFSRKVKRYGKFVPRGQEGEQRK